MKYEHITLLRRLILDEINRKEASREEYHSMDDMQRSIYSQQLKIIKELKEEIDKLDFKIS